ncbi:MAG: efflux RND transporter permease subunit [bacterium]
MAAFPGMKAEFMPPLDEGSFLWMPTTMPHASLGESLDALQLQDRLIAALPEVKTVVGKIGRVDSALDPAPISMVETIIFYHPEYGPPDPETGERRRLWREHIKTPDDIWRAISATATIPGSTAAPRLQPIAARIVMLQSGVRAPMAVKVRGQDLAEIEAAARAIEALLKGVEGVRAEAVQADRIVGKPYLEIHVDRDAIARHGLELTAVQRALETAVGGSVATVLIDGRVRRPVRVRYPASGATRGARRGAPLRPRVPMCPSISSPRSTSCAGRWSSRARTPPRRRRALRQGGRGGRGGGGGAREGGAGGCPGSGRRSWRPASRRIFTGTFENQVRAQRGLLVILPLSLALIFLILYLQFRKVSTSLLVFRGSPSRGRGLRLPVAVWRPRPPGLDRGGRTLGRGLQRPDLPPQRGGLWASSRCSASRRTTGWVISTYLEQQAVEAQPESVEALREATVAACCGAFARAS